MNGSTIPEVDFDVGPSYAGLLPISSAANETRKVCDRRRPSWTVVLTVDHELVVLLVFPTRAARQRRRFDFLVYFVS